MPRAHHPVSSTGTSSNINGSMAPGTHAADMEQAALALQLQDDVMRASHPSAALPGSGRSRSQAPACTMLSTPPTSVLAGMLSAPTPNRGCTYAMPPSLSAPPHLVAHASHAAYSGSHPAAIHYTSSPASGSLPQPLPNGDLATSADLHSWFTRRVHERQMLGSPHASIASSADSLGTLSQSGPYSSTATSFTGSGYEMRRSASDTATPSSQWHAQTNTCSSLAPAQCDMMHAVPCNATLTVASLSASSGFTHCPAVPASPAGQDAFQRAQTWPLPPATLSPW